MFVFKAAVVGAGVMGGEIAQVDRLRRHPRRAQGRRPEVRRRGARRRRARSPRARSASSSRRASSPRSRPTQQVERTLGLITGTTAYDGFGDVDFVDRGRARSRWRSSTRSSRTSTPRRRPRDPRLATPRALSITEIGDVTQRPDKVVGFHFFWPASRMRLIEVDRGRRHVARDGAGGRQLRPGDPQDAVRCGECPGFVVNRILVSTAREIWRYQDETGVDVEALDAFINERGADADGPVPRRRHARASTRWSRSPATCATPTATASTCTRAWRSWSRAGELGAKTGKGFYEHGRLTRRRSTSGSPSASSSRRSSRPASCSRRASRASATSTSG